MVVEADDADHAYQVAQDFAGEAISDANEPYQTHVTGEVARVESLRSGWNGECIPYGGDGKKRIREFFGEKK